QGHYLLDEKSPATPSRKVRETPQKIGTARLTLLYRTVRSFRLRSGSRCADFYCCPPHRPSASARSGATARRSLWTPAEPACLAAVTSRLLTHPDCCLLVLLPLQRLP